MKQIALTVLALTIAFTSGCGAKPPTEVYYLIATNVGLPYWQTMANGFNKAAAQYTVAARVVGPSSYDPQAELDALKQAVAAKPSGILISVADVSVLEREIDSAIQQGIPVITVDSDGFITHRLFFIGTNNLEAGRLGGNRLVEKLGNKGNVVFFTIPGQPNIEDRLMGFKEVLNSAPGIKIANIVDIKGDPNVAFDQAQKYTALTGAQKIDAFVCLEAVAGKPVVDAIKRANLQGRELITWDTDPGTLDAIQDGTVDATIAQKPYTMGYFGLQSLHGVFHALPAQLNKDFRSDSYSPYPGFVDTGSTLVDMSNVGLYNSATAVNK